MSDHEVPAWQRERSNLLQSINRLALSAQNLKIDKCYLEAILAGTAEGMIVLDLNGKLNVVNPVAQKILGIESVDNKMWTHHLTAYVGEGLIEVFAEALISGRAIQRDVHVARQERELILHVHIAPLHFLADRPSGLIVIMRDVTKEREIMNQRNEFLAMASHEIRSPMTNIKVGVGALLDGMLGPVMDEQLNVLQPIKHSVDRLIRLVNDLLDMAKYESGQLILQCEAVDMVQLVHHVREEFQTRCQKHRLRFDVELPETLVLHVDGDKVIQILTNLVSNALKFTPKGGIKISAKRKGDMVKFVVADTGIGLSSADIVKLFSKFSQMNQAVTREKGTGLGLSIAKQLVEVHGGDIWVTSKKGEGTNVIFTLPNSRQDAHNGAGASGS